MFRKSGKKGRRSRKSLVPLDLKSPTPSDTDSLPPGYQAIEFTPPPIEETPTAGIQRFRMSFTYLVRIRVTPASPMTLDQLLPVILNVINKTAQESLEWKRILGAVVWASQPQFSVKVTQGIPGIECFKTGQGFIDILTQNPQITMSISTAQSVKVADEFRSLELDLSLFHNQNISGQNLTVAIANGKQGLLGQLLTFNVCDGPQGIAISFI
nr:MAG: hypothetical protein [Dicrocoelium Rhabdo-like virus 2]